jgi:FkbM family methyltransferase
MVLLRKLRVLSLLVARCRNWPALARTRLGGATDQRVVRLRDGLQLAVEDSIGAHWGQFFEAAIADVYRIRGASADLIVDVGANIGSFTCLAAYTHRDAVVYAFEPQPNVADTLETNLALNQLTNVRLSRSPVTGDGRVVDFSQHDSDGSSGIFLAGSGPAEKLSSVTFDVIPFDKSANLFIKLDCEGAEGELIEWLVANEGRLPRSVRIAAEYHPWCNVPLAKSVDRLKSAGFDISIEHHFDEPYLFASRGSVPNAADHS